MRWGLSPPSPTGFHDVIICTGGSAAARLHLRLFSLSPFGLKNSANLRFAGGGDGGLRANTSRIPKPPNGGENFTIRPGAEFFTMRSIFHHNSAELFFIVEQNVKNAPCGRGEKWLLCHASSVGRSADSEFLPHIPGVALAVGSLYPGLPAIVPHGTLIFGSRCSRILTYFYRQEP